MAAHQLLGPKMRPPMIEASRETVDGVERACAAYEARS